MLKESDDLDILGVTFDSKMILIPRWPRSVSRASSQRLGILRKSWQVFHDGSLFGWWCLGFVLTVLEYCSTVWCSPAVTHIKLLNRVGKKLVFKMGLCLSVTLLIVDLSQYVLCLLYKIKYNPMHPLYGAIPVPYVPVLVIRGSLVVHRYTYAPPRCRTSQFRRTFISLSPSLWNDSADPVFDGVGLAGFKRRHMHSTRHIPDTYILHKIRYWNAKSSSGIYYSSKVI